VSDTTEDRSSFEDKPDHGRPIAGLAVVWTGARPTLQVVEVGSQSCTLGRGGSATITIDDPRMSREHVEITHRAGRWTVRDRESRNHTFVDAIQVSDRVTSVAPRVIRAGDTLVVPIADVRELRRGAVEVIDGIVIGPTLRAAHEAIEAAARAGSVVHITGESGSGKELAARRFHDAGPTASGPFVAVNCAAIPAALAESLLFGVRKGAYSGAEADRDGYLAAADGGTLFLDEIGDLPLELQPKLLRALESQEVLAVGATRPRRIQLRLVSATHHALRSLVADGEFREDLYYRLARPAVTLPPLRARIEDLGYLAATTVRRIAPKVELGAGIVEQILLRPWPGNARELVGELVDAVARAMATDCGHLAADHLSATAGMPFVEDHSAGTPLVAERSAATLDLATAHSAVEAARGNVAAAARALGVHRTQLRRLLAKK
jgi:transcriptional regulator with PAS, ATPase and Fis domain